ncbi:MAG: ABC transporter permease subunit [Sporichthyaceae bacterium]
MNLMFNYLGDVGNWSGAGGIGERLGEHLAISLGALVVATAFALPLGVMVGHSRRGDDLPILFGTLGRLLPPLGVLVYFAMKTDGGTLPAFAVIVLMTAAPIMSAAYRSVRLIDRNVVESARAAGMLPPVVLREVEIPMAMPALVRGVRRAAVAAVAMTAVAAYVGAGGLGRMILDGQSPEIRNYGMVAAGGLLLAVVSVVVHLVVTALGKELIPPGLSARPDGPETTVPNATPIPMPVLTALPPNS